MSQGSGQVPTSGPDHPTTFAGQINNAFLAGFTKNSGGTAPANVNGAAIAGQLWNDTTDANNVQDKEFDGGSWVKKGEIDPTNHVYRGKIGGGSTTLSGAGGGAIDIGSLGHGDIQITGTTAGAAITGFGSNAKLQVGERKLVRFGSAGIITYNVTSMITPTGQDLSFGPNDAMNLLYLGSGNWLVFAIHRANGYSWATGQLVEFYASGTIPGLVRLNGLTIGSGATAATERANDDTVNLFVWIYLQDPNAVVSGGRTAPGNTRSTALTDFAANKLLTLPDTRTRVLVSPSTFGNSEAHRALGVVSPTSAATLGTVAGEAAHQETLKEQVPHTHTASATGLLFVGGGSFGPTSGSSGSSNPVVVVNKSGSGGEAVTVTSASPGVVTCGSNHNFQLDQPIQFDFETGGGLPTGVSAGTTYYVSELTSATQFKFSATPGGANVNTSSTGTNVFIWRAQNNMPPFIVIPRYIAL